VAPVAAFLGLLLIGLSAWTAQSAYERAREDQERTLEQIADAKRHDLEAYFERARALTALMARNGVFAGHRAGHEARASDAEVGEALSGLDDLTHGVGEACLTDESGKVHACAIGDEVTPRAELWPDYSWTTFFRPALELESGEVHQTRPYVSNTNHRVLANATPVPQADGKRAIIHVETPIDAFRREALRQAAESEVAVVEQGADNTPEDDTLIFDTALGADAAEGSATGEFVPAGELPTPGQGFMVAERMAVHSEVDAGPDNVNDWVVVARSRTPAPTLARAVGATQLALFAGGVLLLSAAALLVRYSHRAAEETARMKGDLLGLVSHELRTPLTSIVGYTELLIELEAESLSDQGKNFLEVIDRNAKRELRLVGDLLTLQQIDRGGFEITPQREHLAPIVEASLASALPKAKEKEIEIEAELDPALVAPSDPERLGQVLDNLLSNAVKYTPKAGSVDVRLFAEGGSAVIEVEDSGLGIPPDELDRLFERMFRASNATERHIPGIGLGLAIVKALVEAHGGHVRVRSVVDEGTTFRVELPGAELDPEGAREGAVAVPA
jgi:signal transduction histidine kinase